MIKLLISDLDGTFMYNALEHDDIFEGDGMTIPEKNKTAVQHLLNNNIEFGIATGRPDEDIEIIMNDLPKFGIRISQNGSYIIDSNNVLLHKNVFEAQQAKEVVDFLNHNGIDHFLCDFDTYYVSKDNNLELLFFDMDDSKKVSRLSSCEAISSGIEVAHFCITIDPKKETVEEVEQYLNEHLPHYSIYITSPFSVDICAPNTTKGDAVKFIANHYGLELDEIATIGDSGNDYSMLELTNYSFAMSHASDKIKSCANFEVDMVSHAIEKIIEINTKEQTND